MERLWSYTSVIVCIAGASTIYGAQRLLHNLYFCYVQVAAFAVRSVTIDCNIEELGCSNAAEIPVEMLLEDICKTLLLIATVTHVCLRQTLSSCRMKTHPVFNIMYCTISPVSPDSEI